MLHPRTVLVRGCSIASQSKKRDSPSAVSFVLALPIFPVRLQTSIFGAGELNFRVRDGNGWTLTAINTNSGAFPHPQNRTKQLSVCLASACISLEPFLGQALGLLVPVSSIHYCTSTSGLSTSSSTTCLTPQGMRDLILGKVSRLDAFSVYLVRT